MECKKCGAVAPENATFCPSCGERVDGKKVCARCA
ncbi:MAG: zinc-ribbon domain-containing protein [Clostridia bacterium]|nr:zinc-ribbon domain-containing protein [Clostridia bacterium]